MESYDIFLLVVLAAAIAFGALKGMAWQIASLSAIFVSYFVALNFHELVAGMIKADEPWNRYIAMFALYMGTSLAIWIAFAVVRDFIEKVELKDFDRHAGAALGAINGAILCLLITLFAVTLPIFDDEQKTAICRSKSGHVIAHAIGKIKVGLPGDVDRVVTPYLDGLKEKLDDHHHPDGDDDHSAFADQSSTQATGQAQSGEPSQQPTFGFQPPSFDNGFQSGVPLNWRDSNSERTAERSILDEVNQHIQTRPRQ